MLSRDWSVSSYFFLRPEHQVRTRYPPTELVDKQLFTCAAVIYAHRPEIFYRDVCRKMQPVTLLAGQFVTIGINCYDIFYFFIHLNQLTPL